MLGKNEDTKKRPRKTIDPLIRLFKNKPDALELFGCIWEILYIAGTTPDIGIRREHVLRVMLEEEFGLKVNSAPPRAREWDFSIVVEGKEIRYSLKTTEGVATVKVAWNGFPSMQEARKFEFKCPILYITRDKKNRKISVYVFDVEDLKELKEEKGDTMWWIPKRGTNPRGFGINTKAVRILMEKAKSKGNFLTVKYPPIEIDDIKKRKYWRMWYNVLKKLVLES